MTSTNWEFMPEDRQLFRWSLGEALARLVRQKWPHHTAKIVSREWGIERSTAENLIKGHASERTISKAVEAEGWDLLDALGQAITGQTHHEWEEQKLKSIIEEAERAQGRIRSLRSARERLETRAAALDAVRDRQGDDLRRRADRRGGGEHPEFRDRTADRSGDAEGG